jgi:hypothetical protein
LTPEETTKGKSATRQLLWHALLTAMKTYKFFPPDRLDFLENLGVRFTQPSELNDPSELLPTFMDTDVAEYIKDLKLAGIFPSDDPESEALFIEHLNSDPSITRSIFLNSYKEGTDKIGVFSLSKSYNNPLMWAHYSRNYTGYVVEFDASHPFFQTDTHEPPILSKITDVIYSKNRRSITIRDSTIEPADWITKHPNWRYEKEQRMIRLRERCDASFDNGRISIWFIPSESVVSLTLGNKALTELKKAASRFLVSNPHVKLYVADPESKIDTVQRNALQI